jgi:hypothetical protein
LHSHSEGHNLDDLLLSYPLHKFIIKIHCFFILNFMWL